ncbi:hypothetical protein [Wenzhouxiangella marina]|uniref:Uncharacterized protein n=1 Tax=Wenzhouxiangella marina TaxID=1579979 RepID=A0A0K0XV59_9GAMM|nr:hypothetical protein [Wenzhouxiangella marina]AKS41506.1 hypothetical protein WM2015_1132 [Wenzhouxiangella marina]MBB6086735.1 ketosteroid isomerase-like protein [Wenzhouxiangella marina]
MRWIALISALWLAASVQADHHDALSEDEIRQLVDRVNRAQNGMMRRGSDAGDVDALFDLYTEDFTYVHEVHGGVYTRDELYANSMRYAEAGQYQFTEDRYRILHVLPGLDAAAVQRLESSSGKKHLAVFEFEGGKVSRILEYWQ